MDRYKFRGKPAIEITSELEEHVKDGWVYGSLIGSDLIVGGVVDLDEKYFNTEFWMSVDPATVGQYTGLKDKNGKEIYEGDIVQKIEHDYRMPNTYELLPEIGKEFEGLEVIDFEVDEDGFLSLTTYGYKDVVSLDRFRFWLKSESFGYECEDLEDPKDFVVIGNIHDNPELLEG